MALPCTFIIIGSKHEVDVGGNGSLSTLGVIEKSEQLVCLHIILINRINNKSIGSEFRKSGGKGRSLIMWWIKLNNWIAEAREYNFPSSSHTFKWRGVSINFKSSTRTSFYLFSACLSGFELETPTQPAKRNNTK